jgi:hypothetical protein
MDRPDWAGLNTHLLQNCFRNAGLAPGPWPYFGPGNAPSLEKRTALTLSLVRAINCQLALPPADTRAQSHLIAHGCRCASPGGWQCKQ